MLRSWAKGLSRGESVLALALVGGSILAFAFPTLSSLLVYQRQAVLSGELWRLYTGDLVHFSASHLLLNLAGLLMALAIAKARGYAGADAVCLWSATVAGGAIFLLEPGMEVYGGLSGIVNGLVAFVACRGMREGGSWRTVSVAVLLGLIGNSVVEAVSGSPTLAGAGEVSFLPATMAHVAGGLTGAVAGWLRPQEGDRPTV